MTIDDPALRARIALEPCCRCAELGNRQLTRTHCHHILHRGAGGGMQVDKVENLLPLCANCHGMVHALGMSGTEWCWHKAGERCYLTAEECEERVRRVLYPDRDIPEGFKGVT